MQIKIIFVLILFFSISVSYSQDISAQYLNKANSLFDANDYLFAAQMYKFIYETTVDSNLAAEALYKYKKCGDNAAGLFMTKYYLREKFQINKHHDIWNKYFQPVFENQLSAFRDVGINIKCDKLFDLYCANEDFETLNIIATKYANTKWGEIAVFEMIPFGYREDFTPQGIILHSINFLDKFPESKYRYRIYSYLAYAYSDLWNFSKDDGINLSEDELLKADEFRLKAIEYYYKIVDYNRNIKNGEKEYIPFSEDTLIKLKESKHTGIYHYWGD